MHYNLSKVRWFLQIILLILIVPSLCLISFEWFNIEDTDPAIAKIGNIKVRLSEFTKCFNDLNNRANNNSFEQFQTALNNAINPHLIEEQCKKEHFIVSDKKLKSSIYLMPIFQENGKFSYTKYKNILKINNLSVSNFENSLRSQLSQLSFLKSISNSSLRSKSIAKIIEKMMAQTRHVQVFQFFSKNYIHLAQVDPKKLRNWYNENRNLLMVDEQIIVKYFVIKSDDLDSMACYNGLINCKKRHVNYIYIGNNSSKSLKIHDLHSYLAMHPKEFISISKKISEQSTLDQIKKNSGWITENDNKLPDKMRKFIFSLKKNTVSNIFNTASGHYIFIVDDIQEKKSFLNSKHEKLSILFKELNILKKEVKKIDLLSYRTNCRIKQVFGITKLGFLEKQVGSTLIRKMKEKHIMLASKNDECNFLLKNDSLRKSLFDKDLIKKDVHLLLEKDKIICFQIETVLPSYIPSFLDLKDFILLKFRIDKAHDFAYKIAVLNSRNELAWSKHTVSYREKDGLSNEIHQFVMNIEPIAPHIWIVKNKHGAIVIKLNYISTANTLNAEESENIKKNLNHMYEFEEISSFLDLINQNNMVEYTQKWYTFFSSNKENEIM